jgi:hypothetical protein
MRKTLVTGAVATILSAGALLTGSANAMTLAAPAGVRAAIEDANVVEPTRLVCYRSRSGRRICENRRVVRRVYNGYGGYGGYYSPYYAGYGYAPYYGYGYGYGPSIGIGIGTGWGWGGGTTRVVRTRVIRHR